MSIFFVGKLIFNLLNRSLKPRLVVLDPMTGTTGFYGTGWSFIAKLQQHLSNIYKFID